MEKYYEPDSRWHQIKDKEEYKKNLVIKGHFHDQVPKDVIQAYTTAEYLMAHAYYYWPMYDEAFSKILLTHEMAIKLKAKELNIAINVRKRNGEKADRPLKKIINDVCRKDYFKNLKQQLNKFRELRNTQMHPEQHSFMGAMGGIGRNIKYGINTLNRLFKNEEWHKRQHNQLKDVQKIVANLKDELLTVESGKKGTLVSTILDYDIVDDTLFIVCLPIFDVDKLKPSYNGLPDPVTYHIRDYKLDADQIEGTTMEGDVIRVIKADRPELNDALKKYQRYLEKIPAEKQRIISELIAIEAPWELVRAEYQYYSNTLNKCHLQS